MSTKITNLDMFDPLNREHLVEFLYLHQNGRWSPKMAEYFGDVEYVPLWHFHLKIAPVLTNLVLLHAENVSSIVV